MFYCYYISSKVIFIEGMHTAQTIKQ